MRVGIDLVQVSRMAESVEKFGDRFLSRVFTPGEIAYATLAPAQANERLAARFAAKEATLKALRLVNDPMNWKDIEVTREEDGACALALHGHVRDTAAGAQVELCVSLSHEGDYATAVVVAHGRNDGGR